MRPRRQWIHPPQPAARDIEALVRACDVPPALARLLWGRGHQDAAALRSFLDPNLDTLHDPLRMADMDRAAERLDRAIRDGERVVVSGDYDCDGVTGTALLTSELRTLGAQVDFFIPDRERDGYGISPRLVERSAEVGIRVLISVDCGSSEHATIARARDVGIDVIVVDHHEIPLRPEGAYAVLNPKRADCAYPFKGLSAVGVGYKLLQAVCARRGVPAPAHSLDFVALGTLADSQPVLDENRTLVALGLQCLTHGARPGIQALRTASGVHEAVRSRQVGFRLVPRLNAVGRVARGKLAVDLLLAPDARSAAALAQQLEAHNVSRRAIEHEVTRVALERAAALFKASRPAAIVLASEDWHPGVVGITAARLVDRFEVPAAVIGFQNGVGRGSVRTPEGIDVKAALDAAREVLVRYGGHREAAGFTIEPAQVAAFTELFTAAIGSQDRDRGIRPLVLDAALGPDEIETALATALDRLEPFGSGHSEPVFWIPGLRVGRRTRRVGDGHLKLDLETSSGASVDGIAFGWGESFAPVDAIGRRIDVAAHVRMQDPRWGSGVQLVVLDLDATDAAIPVIRGAAEGPA
jgi:single-stranded-DNA-specific exonuclease